MFSQEGTLDCIISAILRELEVNGLIYKVTCVYRINIATPYNYSYIWLIWSIIQIGLTNNKTPNQTASFELNYGWAWASSAPICLPILSTSRIEIYKYNIQFSVLIKPKQATKYFFIVSMTLFKIDMNPAKFHHTCFTYFCASKCN